MIEKINNKHRLPAYIPGDFHGLRFLWARLSIDETATIAKVTFVPITLLGGLMIACKVKIAN